MLGGYAGKMLFVDLTNNKIEEKELTNELAKNFLGGYGIGAKVLYDMMPAGVDPLGPESVLGFVSGPTNASKAAFGGHYKIVFKSPVYGGWSDANSGGYFGPELKNAGFDAVFFSGIAEKPVYLWINDGNVEIRDASHLWGKDTKETEAFLREELGDEKVRVAAIGPSGERLSLISCPINDGHRAPARGGGGAVMGSKKLKAIAVRGTGTAIVADSDKITELNKKVAAALKTNPGAIAYKEYGTCSGTAGYILNGNCPTKNWEGIGAIDFGEEKARKISVAEFDKFKVKKYACSTCPVGCGAEYEVKTGRWPLAQTERPEYETAGLFGSNLMCDQPDVIFKCNEICNRYGLDTISCGGTVAWAMECYNKGILTKEELDGIDLTWGNGEGIVALTQKIAEVEGCGTVLANGSAFSAKKWGKGFEALVVASGMELAAHDPRFAPGTARTYQFDPSPGRHTKGGLLGPQEHMSNEEKYCYENTGPMDVGVTAIMEVLNSAGFCLFFMFFTPPELINEYVEAITGIPFTEKECYTSGMRIMNLRHAFNLREGLKPADFDLSPRTVVNPPQSDGPLKGRTVDIDLLNRNFFKEMNWDMETGKPALETLRTIGHLENVIKDLYGVDK